MSDTLDADLLDQFVRQNSEASFAELTQRHLNLVYSSALRQTGNDTAAEEITQAVFILLARKASSLHRDTILPGWLYRATQLTAANWQRAEFRRAHREQEAFMQSTFQQTESDNAWREFSPLLDDAMSKLGVIDRDALVLRYFQNRTLAEVGLALGLEERAAQKRVLRALEKLREIFVRKGVVLSASLIACAISANSVQAAPVTLALSAVAAGAKGSAASISLTALVQKNMETITWLKIKTGLAVGAATVFVGAATTAIVLAAHASQSSAEASLLTTNSPFILHVQNPPWITHIQFKRSEFLFTAETPSSPPDHAMWTNMVFAGALQSDGYYWEALTVPPPPFNDGSILPETRRIRGESTDAFWFVFWQGDLADQRRISYISSKLPGQGGAPDDFCQGIGRGTKGYIKRLNLFGLEPFDPDSFRLGDHNNFAAVSDNGASVYGTFNGVTDNKPYGASFTVDDRKLNTQRSYAVKYRYPSPDSMLPNYLEWSETTRKIPKQWTETFTNWIDEVNYGIDPKFADGYHPSTFFTNLDLLATTVVVSNGARYYATKNGLLQKRPEPAQAEADELHQKFFPQPAPHRHWFGIACLACCASGVVLAFWLIIRRLGRVL